MTEDSKHINAALKRVVSFVARNRNQVVGWIIIILSIVILWTFRDYLSSLASILWPIIVGASIIGFRQELKNLLRRVKSLGKEGMQFGDEHIAAQILAVPVADALRAVAPDEQHSAVIQNKVESTRIELNARVPEDRVQREHLLILRLVEAQQTRDFYYIWIQIFLSQFDALVKMASETGAVDLSKFFEEHQSRVEMLSIPSTVKVSFDAWAGYFGRMQIAVVRNESGTITPLGREFLTFATTQNLPRFQGL